VTTPGTSCPAPAARNPFAGLMGSRAPMRARVPPPLSRRDGPDDPSTDPPIVTTRRRHDLGAATSNSGLGQLPALDLVPPGTHTCTAVGAGGSIVTTTDLAPGPKRDLEHDEPADSVTCVSTSFCMAVGPERTVDVFNGTT